MNTAKNSTQPRLFVLPDEEPAPPPTHFPPNYTDMEAYRRVKAAGEVALQVRDRVFVDRPDTPQQFLAQARRNVRAARAYEAEWVMALAAGYGTAIVQHIEWERQKPGNVIRFPVRYL